MTKTKIPVTTINSQYVYQSSRLKVRRDQVIFQPDTPGTYEVVERDDFVLIIPIDKDSFYLVNQYRYPIKSWSLEFPQGQIEPGEKPSIAATRELQEETGLTANKLTQLGYIHLGPGHHAQSFYVFVASNFTNGQPSLETTESSIQLKSLTIPKFNHQLKINHIQDGPTLAAYSLYLTNQSSSK